MYLKIIISLLRNLQYARSNIRARHPSLRRSEACDGQRRANDPTHGPGGPNAAIAHARGEQEREQDAQYEVGKGGDHELLHQAGAPQHAVGHQLGRHDEVERRDDAQEGHAGFQRQPLRALQEHAHQDRPGGAA